MTQYLVICEQLRTADKKLHLKGEKVELTGEEETVALSQRAVVPVAPNAGASATTTTAQQAQTASPAPAQSEPTKAESGGGK